MYRVMMMVMLKDMWRYVKKEKFSLLWYMPIVAIAFQNMAVLLGIETVQVISINLQMADLKKMILVCAAFFLICIVQLMRGIPLRICKAMYLCPAGEKEKERYLFGMLVVKVVVGMIFIGVSLKCLVGVAFWGGDIMFMVIMYGLCFFTLLNVSLTFRMGDTGERRVDENGYVIQTKTEIVVKVYWTCTLLVQWVILFADTVISMTPLVRGIIWGVCFLINLFFVVVYVGAFLKEILLYENVYCQRSKRDDVQYDIC